MEDETLADFVESVCGEDRLRVEQDFGGGFVKLKSSEAEKRQAAQDIRSTEDIVIELLRNARDASARHIFVALQRDEDARVIVIIDDGEGIPPSMHERVFEPRVTSKLDTAHMDKWGMHGRGMALYSVSANAEQACVKDSNAGIGTSMFVKTDLRTLGEKTDQSTFPRFEVVDGTYAMRGPRNILRTAAEFTLEHRDDLEVYCGSFTEIAATLYEYGMASTSPGLRAFRCADDDTPLVKRLAFSVDPLSFTQCSESLGLSLSQRSARRIMDGEIAGIPSLLERLQTESMPSSRKTAPASRQRADMRGLKLDDGDADDFKGAVMQAYRDLAQRYYLCGDVKCTMRVTADAIHLTIPVQKMS